MFFIMKILKTLLNIIYFLSCKNDMFLSPFLKKGNLNQPAAYSVPMVTQAPPMQPLPVRHGVIAQVRRRPEPEPGVSCVISPPPPVYQTRGGVG